MPDFSFGAFLPAPLLKLGSNILWNGLMQTRQYVIVVVIFLGLGFWLKHKRQKLQAAPAPKGQIGREIRHSLVSLAIFACIIPILLALGLGQYMRFYRDVGDYGWPYFFLSIVLMMLVQDTYFYWTHRLMHLRALFRHVHRTHHLSTNPSAISTYAVHPLEALVDYGASLIILFLIPSTGLSLFIFSWVNVSYAVYTHVGYELFPEGTKNHWLGRWINTSAAHNLHHAKARYNYSWYFLFWDRMMGTLPPDHDAVRCPAT